MRTGRIIWIGAAVCLFFLHIGNAAADSGNDQDTWDRFVENTQRQLEDLRKKMKPMTKKMDKMSAEAKSEWQKLADDYSETRKQIAAELGELKVKSGEAWKTGKKKVDSAMEKLEREYRDLKKRYF